MESYIPNYCLTLIHPRDPAKIASDVLHILFCHKGIVKPCQPFQPVGFAYILSGPILGEGCLWTNVSVTRKYCWLILGGGGLVGGTFK